MEMKKTSGDETSRVQTKPNSRKEFRKKIKIEKCLFSDFLNFSHLQEYYVAPHGSSGSIHNEIVFFASN